jgi:hypothetical protein
MDPPLCSRKRIPECGLETFDIPQSKEVQNSTIGGKSDVDKPKGAFYSEHSGIESWKEGDSLNCRELR